MTTLNDNLRLNNPMTTVLAGADFTGSGVLINPAARTLRLMDGILSSDFNVPVRNEGLFQLGIPGTDAQVHGKSFQQTSGGSLQIELGGTASNSYDQLNLTGAATLAGILDVSFIAGFVPALDQTFTILTAPGGISGTFASLNLPSLPAGLALTVSYTTSTVQLKVIGTLPYDVWINSFSPLTNATDKLKGADPDRDGLINLGEFALDGNPATGARSGKIVAKIAPVSGTNALTLTLPVRSGATTDPFDSPGGELGLRQNVDGVSYKIQASDEMTNWTLDVAEVTGSDATAIQSGLPALNSGWVYRTFRSPGAVAGDPREYMRAVIGE
jgi:hypothetical protein